MPLRQGDSVLVTSEVYKGPGVVKFVYPIDHTVGVIPDSVATVVAKNLSSKSQGRAGGGLYVVNEKECTPIVRNDRDAVRRPVARPLPWPFTIGLAGPRKVGKSTTAEMIVIAAKFARLDVISSAFAAPLYRAVAEITGIDEAILRDQSVKDRPLTEAETGNPCLIGRTPRSILEWQGEGIRQFLGVDHWVHRGFAKRATLPGTILLFEDARHGPEYEVCDLVFELRRGGIEYPGNHPSAMPPNPDDVDFVIDMNGMTPGQVAAKIMTHVKDDLWSRKITW